MQLYIFIKRRLARRKTTPTEARTVRNLSELFPKPFAILSETFRNFVRMLSKLFPKPFGIFSECFRNFLRILTRCGSTRGGYKQPNKVEVSGWCQWLVIFRGRVMIFNCKTTTNAVIFLWSLRLSSQNGKSHYMVAASKTIVCEVRKISKNGSSTLDTTT